MSALLALAASAAKLAARPQPIERDETVTYVVRRGDTFDHLSRQYLLPDRDWRALLRLAGIRDPRRLPIGHRIRIPRSWLRYTLEPARLASYRGTVTIRIGDTPSPPAVGMAISEGARLTTAGNSFISLVLADRSTVVIPSQSQVTVGRLRRILLTGTVDYRFDIEEGRVETKVSPVSTSGRYRIETPISMTAVRGTEFRVSYAPSREAAGTEVLTGTVSFQGPADEDGIAVEARRGATASQAAGTRIVELLRAPHLREPGRLQTQDLVTFEAEPVDGAVRYRAVISADAGFIENVAEQFSDTGSFAFADIPNGNLFVRLSAVDESGLEGLAQAYGFSRRLASIRGQVERHDDGYRFRWSGAGIGTRRYRFQLMREAPDTLPIVDEVGLVDDALTLRDIPPAVYFWRVGVTQIHEGEIVEAWTDPEKLTISAPSSDRSR